MASKAARLLELINRITEGREFVDVPEIVARIRRRYADRGEPIKSLLIFVSSNQKTWLIATGEALYCVMDLQEQPRPKVAWRLPKNQIINNERIILTIDVFADEDSDRAGKIVIDGQEPRKFTAALFVEQPISQAVRNMLEEVYLATGG
jgi:hypothetical protein